MYARVFVTWKDTCLRKVIQRLSILKKETFGLFNAEFYFISVLQISYPRFTFLRLFSKNQQFLSCILRPFEGCFAYCWTYWTKMYPIALMCWLPLSAPDTASLPLVLDTSECPPVPNPILESALPQSFCSFPRIPILALLYAVLAPMALNPSLLQLGCNDAREPMSFFYVLRPSEVARYLPSAISEYRDLARWLMTRDLNCWPIFIPRQILLNGVFQ